MQTEHGLAGLRTALAQAVRLLAFRRPDPHLRYRHSAVFWLLLLLVLAELGLGWISSGGQYSRWHFEDALAFPRLLSAEGLIGTLATFGALLAGSWLAVFALRRRAALWSLFVLVLASWLLFAVLTAVASLVVLFQAEDTWSAYGVLRLAWLAAWLLLAWRLLQGFSPASGRVRRAVALLPLSLATVGGFWLYEWPEYWPPDYALLSERMQEPDAAAPPQLDHEAVIYAQPALLQQAIAALPAQRAGVADLYAIGFAGDGNESVFANEVRYFGELVASRYGNEGRTLLLLNDPESATEAPIASLTALRAALHGVAARMDPEEDVLLLFLTTHGSDEHELLVQLGELPLEQVTPAALDAALDASGIRWRIVVVSACYSGGFIEALADPQTLVLTAARADRTSFGCGVASDITWFGQALFAEALNVERDPVAAFALAREAIARREADQDLPASEPQMHLGDGIAERLPGWLATWPDHGAVEFQPPD